MTSPRAGWPRSGSVTTAVASSTMLVSGVLISIFFLHGAWWWTIPWMIFVSIICLRYRWSARLFIKFWAVQTLAIAVGHLHYTRDHWWASVGGALIESTVIFLAWQVPAWVIASILGARHRSTSPSAQPAFTHSRTGQGKFRTAKQRGAWPYPGSLASAAASATMLVSGVLISIFFIHGGWWWTIPWMIFVSAICLRYRWSAMLFVKFWAIQAFVTIVGYLQQTPDAWWSSALWRLLESTVIFLVWQIPAWAVAYLARDRRPSAEDQTVAAN